MTELVLDQIPLFPAHVSATNGFRAVIENGVDIVITPYYQDLVQVPAVTNVDSTYFMAWDKDIDYYQTISFEALAVNIGEAIVAGNNLQPFSAALTSIAGLTTSANQMIYTTAPNVYATTALTAFGRSLIDDANAAAARTTLALGSMATQDAASVAITGGSISGINDLAIADGGTGASSASAALSNLGAAPLASPALTGNPTAPTPSPGDNDTSIATTAFVATAITAANQKFVSSQLTMVFGNTPAASAAHGLGVTPTDIRARIVCVDPSGDQGYVQGDVIPLLNFAIPLSGFQYGCTVWADANNINITTPDGIIITHKTTRTLTGITVSKWRVIFEARP